MIETPERRFIHSPNASEMPKTADVVIIGGGMAGPAASWALQEAMPGIQTVLLEQANQLATGASAASIENFRSSWPTPCLIAQMSRSIEIFTHADQYLGEGSQKALNIRQRGYLYTGFNPEQAHALQSEVDDLHQKGLGHVEYLDQNEVHHRYPWLGPNVVAAKFDPQAGWLDSNGLAYQFAKAGEQAKFLLGMQQSSIIVEGDRVVGVMTEKGIIKTSSVIIAAGPGSRQIGRTAGIELPIVMRPRHSFTTPVRDHGIPADAPFTIGYNPRAYMRPEGEAGAIFGWEYNWKNRINPEASSSDYLVDPLPLDQVMDPRFPGAVLEVLGNQFGDIFNESYLRQGVRLRNGYYVSRAPEDGRPNNSQRAIIDKHPDIEGLYLSVAHVGHGVMSSPASGEMVAAYVLGNEQSDPIFKDFRLNVKEVKDDGGTL